MSDPVFKNVQNECVILPDGREVWLSRSCAVVGAVFADVYMERPDSRLVDVSRYVLITKRGPACPDNVGKWVMPCGYLDRNENLGEAAVREVWEEAGLHLPDMPNFKNSSFADAQPVYVNSNPTEGRQNVTSIFSMLLRVHPTGAFSSLSDLPQLYPNKGGVPNEVDDAIWIPVQDVSKYDMAFNHAECIKTLTNTL